jgi:Meckel syndrome type 1 protein
VAEPHTIVSDTSGGAPSSSRLRQHTLPFGLPMPPPPLPRVDVESPPAQTAPSAVAPPSEVDAAAAFGAAAEPASEVDAAAAFSAAVAAPPSEVDAAAAFGAASEPASGVDAAVVFGPPDGAPAPAPVPPAAAALPGPDAIASSPATPAAIARAAAAAASAPIADRPVIGSWLLQSASNAPSPSGFPAETTPSALKRFAPFGVALAAVIVAFFAGHSVGYNRAESALATKEPAVRAAAAKPTAPHLPAPEPVADKPAPREDEPATAASAQADSANTKAVAKGAPPFNAKVAQQLVARTAAKAVKSCKKTKGGGGGVATVTFAPAGRVDDVVISGAKVAGTPAAECVASSLRQVKLAAFSGQAQTVKATVAF